MADAGDSVQIVMQIRVSFVNIYLGITDPRA